MKVEKRLKFVIKYVISKQTPLNHHKKISFGMQLKQGINTYLLANKYFIE